MRVVTELLLAPLGLGAVPWVRSQFGYSYFCQGDFMSTTGVGDGRGRGARNGAALAIACACALASASCSEDVVRAKGARSALGAGSSPDASAPDPSSLQAAPPPN